MHGHSLWLTRGKEWVAFWVAFPTLSGGGAFSFGIQGDPKFFLRFLKGSAEIFMVRRFPRCGFRPRNFQGWPSETLRILKVQKQFQDSSGGCRRYKALSFRYPNFTWEDQGFAIYRISIHTPVRKHGSAVWNMMKHDGRSTHARTLSTTDTNKSDHKHATIDDKCNLLKHAHPPVCPNTAQISIHFTLLPQTLSNCRTWLEHFVHPNRDFTQLGIRTTRFLDLPDPPF